MIEERARVLAVEGELAWVEAERRSACSGCAARSGCGAGALSTVLGRRMSRMIAINRAGARPGDEVIVGVAEQGLVRGSFAVYTAPLLAMFAAALAGEWLLPGWGEGGVLAGGALGLAAGLVWLRRFGVRIGTDPRYQPVVLRRLASAADLGTLTG